VRSAASRRRRYQGQGECRARAALQLAGLSPRRRCCSLAAACVTDTRGVFLVYPVPRRGGRVCPLPGAPLLRTSPRHTPQQPHPGPTGAPGEGGTLLGRRGVPRP